MGTTTALLSIALSLAQAGGGIVPAPPELREIDSVQLLELVRRTRASAVLVNVWATWCEPCHDELPALLAMRREWGERGLELVLVSADFPSDMDRVREFLHRNGVDFTSYIRVGDDAEFNETLRREWSGRLPASFVFDSRGRQRYFWEGPADPEQLRAGIASLIGPDRDP